MDGNHGFCCQVNWSGYSIGSHLVEVYAVDGSNYNPKIGSSNYVIEPIPTLPLNKSSYLATDNWTYTFTTTPAYPNMPVYVTSWVKSGNSYVKHSTSCIGNADAEGKLSKSGTFDSSLVGDWKQQATIGNKTSN